jgi:UDP-hydrolysing UDP-N-acetyl-D-glucosamine 2-epimerase
MRTIAAVTVARSDWGLYLPILTRLRAEPGVRLHLIAAGTHLSAEFGATVAEIEDDGFVVDDRVETVDEDSPLGVARSMGRAVQGYAEVYDRVRPDLVLVLGDRFEMHAAALAAVPFTLPIAHVQGGELTLGAIDDQFRHSITKLAHLHFPSTEQYGRRLLQMGEEPWRVVVAGAPAIDNLLTREPLAQDELERRIGFALDEPTLLVTYHPVTLEYEDTERQVRELLTAIDRTGIGAVFTYPNVDTSGRSVVDLVRAFADGRERTTLVENLGSQAYLTLMRHAAAMVGNSSSGIIEAVSFELPVVNVGSRQEGRVRPGNVIDVGYDAAEIEEGLRRALEPEFREGLRGLENPYGDGHAAERIVRALLAVELGKGLLFKRFTDLEPAQATV